MTSGYIQPEQSPIEKAFWEKAKPIIPELENEVWIGKYRVDFLIPSKKLIIELYGYQYHNTKKKITKDAERERSLQKSGYRIIRFTGTEIFKDVNKCVKEVLTLANIEPNKALEKWKKEPEILQITKQEKAEFFQKLEQRQKEISIKPTNINQWKRKKKGLNTIEQITIIILAIIALSIIASGGIILLFLL